MRARRGLAHASSGHFSRAVRPRCLPRSRFDVTLVAPNPGKTTPLSDPKSYTSPLAGRYASEAMRYLFSAEKKFMTWRELWLALAESEAELGISITERQLCEMLETLSKEDQVRVVRGVAGGRAQVQDRWCLGTLVSPCMDVGQHVVA